MPEKDEYISAAEAGAVGLGYVTPAGFVPRGMFRAPADVMAGLTVAVVGGAQ